MRALLKPGSHGGTPAPPEPAATTAPSTLWVPLSTPRTTHDGRPRNPRLVAGGEGHGRFFRWSIGGAGRQPPPPHSAPLYYRALYSPHVSHEFMRNQCSRAPMLAGTTSSMLPLIASGLLGWSVSSPTTPNVTPNVLHDREHHYAEGTAMASLPPKEKGQPPTWSLAYWGLDELGSIEWRGMMAALIPSRYQSKQSERLAANRADSSRK